MTIPVKKIDLFRVSDENRRIHHGHRAFPVPDEHIYGTLFKKLLNEFCGLGGRYPGEMEPAHFDADMLQKPLQ